MRTIPRTESTTYKPANQMPPYLLKGGIRALGYHMFSKASGKFIGNITHLGGRWIVKTEFKTRKEAADFLYKTRIADRGFE